MFNLRRALMEGKDGFAKLLLVIMVLGTVFFTFPMVVGDNGVGLKLVMLCFSWTAVFTAVVNLDLDRIEKTKGKI